MGNMAVAWRNLAASHSFAAWTFVECAYLLVKGMLELVGFVMSRIIWMSLVKNQDRTFVITAALH